MSRINRVPVGLQSLLGASNFGDNPSELSQVTAPVLDLLPYLAAERVSLEREQANLTAQFQVVDLVVPEGELWLPLQISGGVYAATQTAAKYQFSVDLRNIPGAGGTFALPLARTEYVQNGQPGQQIVASWTGASRPFLLQSGTIIQCAALLWSAGTGSNDGMAVWCHYIRLEW